MGGGFPSQPSGAGAPGTVIASGSGADTPDEVRCLFRENVVPGFPTLCCDGESRGVVIPAFFVGRVLVGWEAAVDQSQQMPSPSDTRSISTVEDPGGTPGVIDQAPSEYDPMVGDESDELPASPGSVCHGKSEDAAPSCFDGGVDALPPDPLVGVGQVGVDDRRGSSYSPGHDDRLGHF